MKITVLGTGAVGRTLAGRLDELGHEVVIGTRDVARTMAHTDGDRLGHPSYAQWQQEHPGVVLLPFPESGAHGEVVINATAGVNALSALQAVGADILAGKVLLDLALPLDFSHGMPPTLTIAGDDSLGEQTQRAYPDTRVVKTLNTVYMDVMVDPARVPGQHNLFIAGEDAEGKRIVTAILGEFGWTQESILDLGGIQGARATEMYMQLYFQLVAHLDTFDFNIAVVRK